MRSLKHQILFLTLGSLLLLAISFMTVLGWHMRDRAIAAAIIKAKSDLGACAEIIDLKYPGPWSVQDGSLYKGKNRITLDNDLVDHLAKLTGDTVTVFLGDTRTATTVRGASGERAIGTKVSDIVAETVLKNGQTYLGQADVVGQKYQTAYEPIRTTNGAIIGMLYVGISHNYEQEMIADSLLKMALLGIALTLIIGFLTWFFIQKVIIHPLHDITLGTRDMATGHLTGKVEVTGSKEIGELAMAFNQMVERLENLAGDITRVRGNEKSMAALREAATETPDGIFTANGPKTSDLNEENPAGAALSDIDSNVPLNQLQTAGFSQNSKSTLKTSSCIGETGLPKGLNETTLRQIVQFLQETSHPISAEDVAEGVNLTRVTVRRYLDFLEQCGVLQSDLKYGTVGRPVKLFTPTT